MEQTILRQILDAAVEAGGEFAEVYYEEKDTTAIQCEKHKIEKATTGTDKGVGIRVISGENTAYGYTNDLTLENMIRIAKTMAKAAQSPVVQPVVNFAHTEQSAAEVELHPKEVEVEEKIQAVKIADEAARLLDDHIKQALVSYSDTTQRVQIANSLGVCVEEERVRTRMSITAIAEADGMTQTGFASFGGTEGFEIVKEEDPAKLGQTAAERAMRLLSAKPCPGGKMPVVMAEEAGGTMVHEACGHGLEGDLIRKGMSVYRGKLGEEVASPLVTVVDDATMKKKYGSYRYDDEGRKAQRNTLIRNGVLEQYMYDYHTARQEGTASTANGRRESYRVKPITRMSNTLILPGKDKKEEIIRSVSRGLLVTKMGGGQVNSISGDYVFDVAEGYLIEDGEILHAVRGATLAGNGPESLRQVEMVADDLGFSIGTCGKSGQSAPVSDAQPTMKINGLVVGGTAEHCEFTIERK